MSYINYSDRWINVKIVLMGSEGAGLPSLLTRMYNSLTIPKDERLIQIASEGESLVSFSFQPQTGDWQPVTWSNYKLRVGLASMPTRPGYSEVAKLRVAGVDGAIFVFDSDPSRREVNREAWELGIQYLLENRVSLAHLPTAFLFVNRGCSNPVPATIEEVIHIASPGKGPPLDFRRSDYPIHVFQQDPGRAIPREPLRTILSQVQGKERMHREPSVESLLPQQSPSPMVSPGITPTSPPPTATPPAVVDQGPKNGQLPEKIREALHRATQERPSGLLDLVRILQEDGSLLPFLEKVAQGPEDLYGIQRYVALYAISETSIGHHDPQVRAQAKDSLKRFNYHVISLERPPLVEDRMVPREWYAFESRGKLHLPTEGASPILFLTRSGDFFVLEPKQDRTGFTLTPKTLEIYWERPRAGGAGTETQGGRLVLASPFDIGMLRPGESGEIQEGDTIQFSSGTLHVIRSIPTGPGLLEIS